MNGCSRSYNVPSASDSLKHKEESAYNMPIGGVPAMLAPPSPMPMVQPPPPPPSADKYAAINTNPIQQVSVTPVSTFSLDVDTGSYSNVRRFLKEGTLPPSDAVRIEELINYFHYDYPTVNTQEPPFTLNTVLAPTPWNPDTLLLRIAVRAAQPRGTRPPANLVFLIDTSGSMYDADRLPLLRTALRMLTHQLTAQDHIAIVTYAGSSNIALPPTSGERTGEILSVINGLEAA
ncbi:hypothetical protein TI04_12680, partial [Achromatium sp. WMS2]